MQPRNDGGTAYIVRGNLHHGSDAQRMVRVSRSEVLWDRIRGGIGGTRGTPVYSLLPRACWVSKTGFFVFFIYFSFECIQNRKDGIENKNKNKILKNTRYFFPRLVYFNMVVLIYVKPVSDQQNYSLKAGGLSTASNVEHSDLSP